MVSPSPISVTIPLKQSADPLHFINWDGRIPLLNNDDPSALLPSCSSLASLSVFSLLSLFLASSLSSSLFELEFFAPLLPFEETRSQSPSGLRWYPLGHLGNPPL